MIQGIIASLIASSEPLMSRYALTNLKFETKKYIISSFIIIFLLMLPGFFILNNTSLADFTPQVIGLLVVLSIMGIAFNYFWYTGLKKTRIENAEPLILSNWIITILLAVTIYPSERNLLQISMALLSTFTIIALNIKKHHFSIDKYGGYILIAAVCLAVQNIISKSLLEIFSPYILYFLRVSIILFSLLFFIKIDKHDFTKSKIKSLGIINFFITIECILVYWSYQQIGLVLTSILMTFAPIASIWGAKIFLKEEIHKRNIVATIVIMACISISILN